MQVLQPEETAPILAALSRPGVVAACLRHQQGGQLLARAAQLESHRQTPPLPLPAPTARRSMPVRNPAAGAAR